MSFSYTGDPANSNKDAVRFLLGDVVETQAIFSDEEIDWALTQINNIYFAGALIADGAVAKFGGGSDSNVKTKTVGALSMSYGDSEKAQEYRTLAKSLRARGAIFSGWKPYSGGISRSDKKTQQQDTDWDQPAFERGQFDFPGTIITSTST